MRTPSRAALIPALRRFWSSGISVSVLPEGPLTLTLILNLTVDLPLTLTVHPLCLSAAAWEVTPADQAEYWEQVPDKVKLTLHYYNVPCSVEPESDFNPLRIVRTLYQPGDFVVIKVSARRRLAGLGKGRQCVVQADRCCHGCSERLAVAN